MQPSHAHQGLPMGRLVPAAAHVSDSKVSAAGGRRAGTNDIQGEPACGEQLVYASLQQLTTCSDGPLTGTGPIRRLAARSLEP